MKATAMVLAAYLLSVCIAVSARAQAQEEVARFAACCPELVYATNPAYPPYDWAVGQAYEGASIELLAMALPPGVTAKPAVYPWKRALYLAERGDIDLLVSLRITPEREKYLQFTAHPAFPNPIVVFVRKDKSFEFTSWDTLKGKTGGVSLGDTFGGGFDEYRRANLKMEEAPTVHENLHKLDLGRIDYFVTGYYAGLAELACGEFKNPIVTLSPPISNVDIHFGFSRSSNCACLLDYMSKRFEELYRQGVPEALLRKHLEVYGETIRGK